MPNLFGLDIAGIVDTAVSSAGGLLSATLTVVTPGTRTAGALSAGTNSTSTSYPVRGVITERISTSSTAPKKASKILLLGKSIPQGVSPKPLDRITIEGDEYVITDEGVKRDAAGAGYTCSVRGA